MRFIVDEHFFAKLPHACFGVVVARKVNNQGSVSEIKSLLEQAIEEVRKKFQSSKPKEHPAITPYRDAFQMLGINPNRFPCSVEALITRIAKGGSLPDINPVVNLVNAFSLKYILPMGAHDLGAASGDIEVRISRPDDLFIPFGQKDAEKPDDGEIVYASGNMIKTRKWIWRQSDQGKVTESSRDIFLPIDGFANYNLESVISARDELAKVLEDFFNANIKTFLVDKNCSNIEL
ncbi:MAG: phenylalanine--tRNA ligase beta subunit-related protein [Bacillota bacterium]|nr:phenylalanine--tRNA ligase beta subunit-related protein [Bacillota bacterium]